MKALYQAVHTKLATIVFEDIWPSFTPCEFALFNQDFVYFKQRVFERDDRFLGNTSITFEGENIAIFQVLNPDEEEIDHLTSMIVHEMFHAFQMNHQETRLPNDLEGLNYPQEFEHYVDVYHEHVLLVKAVECHVQEEKVTYFMQYLASRSARYKRYENQIKYEMLVETFEGCAEYCGLKALQQLSAEKALQKIDDYKRSLVTDLNQLFEIRKISYASGTLLLLLVDQLQLPIERSSNPMTIIEDLMNQYPSYAELGEHESFAVIIRSAYEDYMKSINMKFQSFFSQSTEIVKGPFTICGYDPMNMVKLEDKILCSNFINLRFSGQPSFIVKGPVVLQIDSSNYFNVLNYTKLKDNIVKEI